MDNVQALMSDYVDTPNCYLGHTGSVTVVTHNVLTSGLLPKHMGWTNEGYRDGEDGCPTTSTDGPRANNVGKDLYITSNFGRTRSSRCRHTAATRSWPTTSTTPARSTRSAPRRTPPTGSAARGSTSIITFGSVTCTVPETGPVPGRIYGSLRGPTGVNVPSYITDECGTRYYVERNKTYDTYKKPASLYYAQDDRYLAGDEPGHEGGDLWATDATLDIMENDPDWSGLFVSLPGVDKAAHMWGGVNDPEAGGARRRRRRRTWSTPPRPPTPRSAGSWTPSRRAATSTTPSSCSRPTTARWPPPRGTSTASTTRSSTTASSTGTTATSRTTSSTTGPSRRWSRWSTPTTSGCPTATPRINVWLLDQSAEKVAEAAGIMEDMPDVTAVWRRDGDHFTLVSPVRWDLMPTKAERKWFEQHAQELVDTQAADYGPDLIATLPDDTTYSVAGDHGGIQRATQQIPIVFAGAGLGSRDIKNPVRSVDVMPTILKAMGITPTAAMDGVAYPLPH